jgi:hypothetical protein
MKPSGKQGAPAEEAASAPAEEAEAEEAEEAEAEEQPKTYQPLVHLLLHV